MNLAELFATWQAWNARDVAEQAARRAETAGRARRRRRPARGLDQDPATPTAIEALAAQHELAELLGGWRWHTVTAAREQGATWHDVAAVTGTDPATAQQGFCEPLAQAEHARRRSPASLSTTPSATAPPPQTTTERARARRPARADRRGDPRHDRYRRRPPDRAHQRPDSVEDGLVTGEIALPGGLPPEDDDEDDELVRAVGRRVPDRRPRRIRHLRPQHPRRVPRPDRRRAHRAHRLHPSRHPTRTRPDRRRTRSLLTATTASAPRVERGGSAVGRE